MIKVSDAAAKQVKISLEQMGDVEVPLRIAIKVQENGSFHYNMGFDSTISEDDKTFDEKRITFVVDSGSLPLIGGMEIDYVEIDGNQEIVFLNPNDPHFKPPRKS
jgi:iron-sulfur cluster assembly accessory protein